MYCSLRKRYSKSIKQREGECRLTVRERVLWIRLSEKIQLQPEYANSIGIELKKEESENPKESYNK